MFSQGEAFVLFLPHSIENRQHCNPYVSKDRHPHGSHTQRTEKKHQNFDTQRKHNVLHNQFDEFSVQDGVIFNNSLKDGNSQIGGWVGKNPNLKQNANTIINEISSKQASNINGAVEVFGKSANLIFANENGFSVNGAAFLNTKGVTLSTGKFNGDFTEVTSNGRVAIEEKG